MSTSAASFSGGSPLSSDNGTKFTSRGAFKGLSLEALKETVVHKLDQANRWDLAEKVDTCHTEQGFCVCTGCERVTTYWNHCDKFYCPVCQPRLARARAEAIHGDRLEEEPFCDYVPPRYRKATS